MRFIFGFVTLLAFYALGESAIEVPDGDPLSSLMALIQGFNSMGALAIAAAVITIAVQALKQFVGLTKPAIRAIVVVLGVAYGVLGMAIAGTPVLEAVISVLFTSGGAVAIYEFAVKPFLKQEG